MNFFDNFRQYVLGQPPPQTQIQPQVLTPEMEAQVLEQYRQEMQRMAAEQAMMAQAAQRMQGAVNTPRPGDEAFDMLRRRQQMMGYYNE